MHINVLKFTLLNIPYTLFNIQHLLRVFTDHPLHRKNFNSYLKKVTRQNLPQSCSNIG